MAPGVAPQPLGGARGAQRATHGGGELGEYSRGRGPRGAPGGSPGPGRAGAPTRRPPGAASCAPGPAPATRTPASTRTRSWRSRPQREHERAHRRRVGPLQVVEHQQYRVLPRHGAQRTEQVGAHGQRVGPWVAVGTQQRETVHQDRRQVRHELVEQPVGEPGLRGVAGGAEDRRRPPPGVARARTALLPAPASPSTHTTPGRPARAFSQASSTTASGPRRPTNTGPDVTRAATGPPGARS